MGIRENELVKKYFRNSDEILNAQQEPIRKGERYLRLSFDGGGNQVIEECVDEGNLHTFGSMRLPDRFQTEKTCKYCGQILLPGSLRTEDECLSKPAKPSGVEEIDKKLCNLVELANDIKRTLLEKGQENS
jgi:hypothetical protein